MLPESEPSAPHFLTPEQLLARWQHVFTLKTLANWRWAGGGPDFVKIRSRVLYPTAAVRAFEKRKGLPVSRPPES